MDPVYFNKRINRVKEKHNKYGDHEFYTNNEEDGQVPLGWINEYIQSMESIKMSAEEPIQWKNGSVLGTNI